MKILVMGASCAGSTTLGNALSARLGFPYFDTDFYFWEQTNVPFTAKREPQKRIEMLVNDLAVHNDYIVGGSLVSWGDRWLSNFDLVVFLYISPALRLQRLKNRELERYGDVIYTDPDRIAAYHKFLDWATAYDTNAISGRTLQVHEEWLIKVSGAILEIRGDTTVQQRVDTVVEQLSKMGCC